MNTDPHPDSLDQIQPADSSGFDGIGIRRARTSPPSVDQPAYLSQSEATQPPRTMHPPPAQRPRTHRRPVPRHRLHARRARRAWSRREQGCLAILLALALVICLSGLLAHRLLLVPPPTNILVLGIDRRPDEGDAVRTDTILLVHADPADRRLVLFSIPRDLWVTIPGQGEERINTAHLYGELETPGSGPARAVETVSYNFGVAVDHYLRLDFKAFRQVIDAAGGIEIDVSAPIIDNAFPTDDYSTMRIEIPAGLQHMDGEIALQYARSRHGNSDFDRATRQQQILVALAKKLTSPSGWRFVPRVYQALRNAVETDLNTRELVRLGLAWQRAGENGMEKIVIDKTLTTPFRTPQGAAVLLPRWELIQPLVQTQFTP